MILQANALHIPLADESCQVCITSPSFEKRIGTSAMVDGGAAYTNLIQFPEALPQSFPPRNQLRCLAPRSAVASEAPKQTLNQQERHPRLRPTAMVIGNGQQSSVSHCLPHTARVSMPKHFGCLIESNQLHRGPIWKLLLKPITMFPIRTLFAFSQFQNDFGLPLLDSEKREKCSASSSGYLVGGTIAVERLAVPGLRFLNSDVTAETLPKKIWYVIRYLLQPYALAINGVLGVASDATVVCRPSDAKKTVAVHCPSKVSQHSIFHFTSQRGGDVTIACKGGNSK